MATELRGPHVEHIVFWFFKHLFSLNFTAMLLSRFFLVDLREKNLYYLLLFSVCFGFLFSCCVFGKKNAQITISSSYIHVHSIRALSSRTNHILNHANDGGRLNMAKTRKPTIPITATQKN